MPNQIVLVVDGPIPSELENVIAYFKSHFSTLEVIYLEKNLGHGEARRIGFEKCNNSLIAIMDSDDICVLDRFQKQLDAFEKYDCDIVGGQIDEFIENPERSIGKRIVPLTDPEIKKFAKKRSPMNQVTIMIKKEVYAECGGYLDWYQNEDYYLWIRMILKQKIFLNLNDVLVKVRVGKDMYYRRGGYKYFQSEKKLQKYMLKNKLISFPRYIINVAIRFVVQVIMTNRMRQLFFEKIRG